MTTNEIKLSGKISLIKKIDTKSGIPMCKASMGINKKNQDGVWESDYINIVAFQDVATQLLNVTDKSTILVTGRLGINKYVNKDNAVVKAPQITASKIEAVEQAPIISVSPETTQQGFPVDDAMPF